MKLPFRLSLPFGSAPLPPPPPPPATVTAAAVAVSTLVSLWLLFLSVAPSRGFRFSKDTVWRIMPFSISALGISKLALSYSCQRDVPAIVDDTMGDIPVTAFSLLLSSEVVAYVFSSVGPRRHFSFLRVPAMIVHATTLLYYVWEPYTGAFALDDAFGRALFPLRYVMWTISVTLMSVSVYFVCESIMNKRVRGMPSWRLEDADALHAQLVSVLQACVGTFASGFLASAITLDAATAGALALLPNGFMAVLSCACMYHMLANLGEMLFRAQENALVKLSGVSRQIFLVRTAITCVWCMFPIVWFAAAANLINEQWEHVGYVVSDLTAKYLLLFVYITTVSNE